MYGKPKQKRKRCKNPVCRELILLAEYDDHVALHENQLELIKEEGPKNVQTI